MEFQSVLQARRSIRKYDPSKKVTNEQILELIKAAQYAPSWKNSQTGRYYAVVSDEMREEFKKTCLPEFNANSSDGAAYIVTTFVKDRSGFERDGNPTNEAGNGWGFYDLGMQNQNLLLAASEMGLGTLVMGIRDEAKIRSMFSIPETEIIVSVIAVGYAAIEPEMPKRKPVEDIVKLY